MKSQSHGLLGIQGTTTRSAPPAAESFASRCSYAMWASGAVFFIGSALDLLILWFFQRQSQPQWEFVAISNTVDALPRFAIAIAFFYLALHLRRSAALGGYRAVGFLSLLLGLGGATLTALIITDYFALAAIARAQPQAMHMLKSLTLKTGALGILFFLIFTPLGFQSMRRPLGR